MTVLKCKMCGGTLELKPGETVAECPYCGTKQTVPNLDNDRKAQLYERANKLRRSNEFDKAFAVYESIIASFPDEAEAYWGELLCKYGIEYVDDPATGKKIPTCHRSSFTSILEDEAFEMVMENCDPASMQVYRQEAKQIEEIRKSIVEISSKEQPYDIFICYKETDDNGDRTIDSVIAQDVYNALVKEGYRVFFSRISLEDKLGKEYEPYIFAALNSAKVMLVFGTKYEYFNAVWVKNEWSRYLSLISKGDDKTLIPCYRDVDVYDMPKEFQRLQSQDMSKVGAIQDLVRGINKIIKPAKSISSAGLSVHQGRADTSALLKRISFFLEDGNFTEADEYCERVLDQEPENANAYLGKLMAELHVRNVDDLKNCEESFESLNSYQKAVRFGNEKLSSALRGYVAYINDRNEKTRITYIYNNALNQMQNGGTEAAFKEAAELFSSIPDFQDATVLAEECLVKAEDCRKDEIYNSAKSKMSGRDIIEYEKAIKLFMSVPGWKDSYEQAEECKRIINQINEEKEEERQRQMRVAEEKRIVAEKVAKKRKYILIFSALGALCIIATVVLFITVIQPYQRIQDAVSLVDDGDYHSAYRIVQNMSFGNSKKVADECLKGISNKFSDAEPGTTASFGNFEQDGVEENGSEEINWRVLAKDNDKILLISECALDARPYNNSETDVTWETCSLRKWLNNDFLADAFDEAEQALILEANITADKNPQTSTDSGIDTKDKVFLLSVTEAQEYFKYVSDRTCVASTYANNQGAYNEEVNGNTAWWLRTSGITNKRSASVLSGGGVFSGGYKVTNNTIAVRPAIWITIK